MDTNKITQAIGSLLSTLFTEDEVSELTPLASLTPLSMDRLSFFDAKIGGIGINNIEVNNSGVYVVDERGIFRPIQYCKAYFAMRNTEWRTREIVHMSVLHLEGIVKCLAKPQDWGLPLGALLTKPYVRKQIPVDIYGHLDTLRVLLNLSKHHMGHEKDTHLFSLENAVFVYFICRKIAVPLSSVAKVKSVPRELTDEKVL